MDDFQSRVFQSMGYENTIEPPASEFEAKVWGSLGRPEWSDESIPQDKRVQDFLRVKARSADISGGETKRVFGTGYQYNAEAEDKTKSEALTQAKELFPGMDEKAVGQQFQLERAHARQAKEGEGWVEYFATRAGPVASELGNWSRTRQYGRALEAFNKGDATPDQIDVIARYERLRQIEASKDTGAAVGSGLARVPAIAGEAYLGGAVVGRLPLAARAGAGLGERTGLALTRNAVQTAAMPSMYLQGGAENQLAHPDESTFQSYAPAYAIGMTQTAILGQLANRLPGVDRVPTRLGRLGVRTGIGMGEMQAADTGLSVFDKVVKEETDKTLGLDTRYGLAGKFVRGDDDAWKAAVVQTATFGAFSSMHGQSPEGIRDAFRSVVDAGAKRGRSRQAVAQDLLDATKPVQDHLAENKVPDPATLQKIVEDAPAEQKPYVKAVADAMVEAYRNPDPEAFKKFLDEKHGPVEPETSKTATSGGPDETQPIAQPTGERPAEAKNQPGESKPPESAKPEIRLGPPDAKLVAKPMEKPRFSRHPLFDAEGKEVGHIEVHLAEDGVLDVKDLRARGAANNENIGVFGNRAMLSLVKQLATTYPTAKSVSGLRASGAHIGMQRTISLDRFRPKTPETFNLTEGIELHPAVQKVAAEVNREIGLMMIGPMSRKGQAESIRAVASGIRKVRAALREHEGVSDEDMDATIREMFPNLRHVEHLTDVLGEGIVGATGHIPQAELERGLRRAARLANPAPPQPPPPRTLAPKRVLTEPVEPPTGLVRKPVMAPPEAPRPEAAFDTVAKTAGLDPFEAHVLRERLKPEARSHEKIANDYEMRKANNEKYTRQQVSNIEKRAREKIVAAGVELPGFTGKESVAAEVHARDKSERVIDAVAAGKIVNLTDLRADPDGVKKVGKKRDAAERIASKRESLSNQLAQEIDDVERAGKTISADRLEHFRQELARLDALEGGRELAPAQPIEAAGKPPAGPPEAPRAKQAAAPVDVLAARIGEAVRRLKEPLLKVDDLQVGVADAKELTRQFNALSKADQRKVTKQVGEDVHAGLNRLHGTLGSMEGDIDALHAVKSKYDVLGFSFGHKEGGKTSFVEDAAAKMLAEQMTTTKAHQGITAMKNTATAPISPDSPTIRERVRQFVQRLRDGFAELGGVMFPATQRASVETADGLARLVSAKDYGRRLAPDLIDKVFPDKVVDHGDGTKTKQKVSDEFMVLVGTVGQERRFRHARQAMLEKANELLEKAKTLKDPEAARAMRNEAFQWQFKAGKVKTLVGQPLEKGGDVLRNPLMTESDFQHFTKDPEVKAALERYREHVVPIIEANYKKAEGLDPDAEIESITQIPGMPINARAWRRGDDTSRGVVSFGGGRDLTAPKQQKLGFARQAKLSAEGYVLHFGDIIENSIARSTELAAKADAYRIAVENGAAKWGRGSAPDEGYQWKLRVDPPRGTQVAGEGEYNLWFKDHDVFKDFVKALDPNPVPWKKFPLSGIFNKATLASLGEFTAHSKNLLTIMFRPGMGPINLIRNVRDVIRNTPEIRARLIEMTRIGAMKPVGFEAQAHQLGSKYNPLTWTGKFLDVIDSAMRLTADQAFTRNSLRVGKEATEGNRRDFINQLGQYNRRAQNWVVQFLRDTGIGPFATAGSTYFINGLKAMTLGHGMRGLDRNADLKMRGEMLLRMSTLLAAIPVINYFAWGRVDGDDNTPLGSVKIGTGTDGKTRYLDLANLTGLTRGARETGLLAFAEGTRPGAKKLGATTADSVDAARRDMFHSAVHPLTGPVVSFGYTAYKGENTLGSHVAARPETDAQLKKLGKTPDQRTSETQANVTAAAIHANPIIGALLQLADMDPGHTKPTTTQEEVFRQMGPFGLKERAMPPGAPHREMTIPNKSTEQQKLAKPLKPVLRK